jgi:hypothetical protein
MKIALAVGCLALTAALLGAAPATTEAAVPSHPAGGGLLSLAAAPSLDHPFDPSVHDYVVRCGTDPVTFTGTAADGIRIRAIPIPPGGTGPTILTGDFVHEIPSGVRAVRFQVSTRAQPTRTLANYHVRCLPPAFPAYTVTRAGQPQASHYVLTTRTWVVVVNERGTPVWWLDHAPARPLDAKFVDGRLVSTLSMSPPCPTTPGEGATYTFRSWDGTPTRTITHGLDNHDLQFRPDGTALAFQCVDSERGLREEARLVELDENGEEQGIWLTEDHIAPEEWVEAPYKSGTFGHLNSIEPNGPDGAIFSARNLDAVYAIDFASGAIAWKLGGTATPESLTVVDQGGDELDEAETATLFAGQHDARVLPDGTVSVMDNGSSASERRPRLLRFRIDEHERRATIVQAISDPRAGYSFGLGSARLLSGGNWVVSWGGANDFFTEVTSTGVPVLTVTGLRSYRVVPAETGDLDVRDMGRGMELLLGAPAGTTFSDVPPGAWYHAGLDWAASRSLISGYPDGRFRPGSAMLRGQFVNLLWELAGRPGGAPPSSFTDVPSGAWYRPALDWAVAEGVVAGFRDGTFRPGDPVRRSQFVGQVWRAAGSPTGAPSSAFVDVPWSAWYLPALAWLVAGGAVDPQATNGRFGPTATVTRAEAVHRIWESVALALP